MKLRSKPGQEKQKIEDELERDKHQTVWELYKTHDGYSFGNSREAQSSAGLQNSLARRQDEYASIIRRGIVGNGRTQEIQYSSSKDQVSRGGQHDSERGSFI